MSNEAEQRKEDIRKEIVFKKIDEELKKNTTMENHDFAFTFLTCMIMVVTVVTSFFVRKEMKDYSTQLFLEVDNPAEFDGYNG